MAGAEPNRGPAANRPTAPPLQVLSDLLARHANKEREILLTLANGVMICKNASEQ